MTKTRTLFSSSQQKEFCVNDAQWAALEAVYGVSLSREIRCKLVARAEVYLERASFGAHALEQKTAEKGFRLARDGARDLYDVLVDPKLGPFLTSVLAPHYRPNDGAALAKFTADLEHVLLAFEGSDDTRSAVLTTGYKPDDAWHEAMAEILSLLESEGLPVAIWAVETGAAPVIRFLQAFEALFPEYRQPPVGAAAWVDRLRLARADRGKN